MPVLLPGLVELQRSKLPDCLTPQPGHGARVSRSERVCCPRVGTEKHSGRKPAAREHATGLPPGPPHSNSQLQKGRIKFLGNLPSYSWSTELWTWFPGCTEENRQLACARFLFYIILFGSIL